MSTFHIDTEIDKLVDKLTEQFKMRLKKLVKRSEKLVLKQYIASQKETMRAARGTLPKSSTNSNVKSTVRPKVRKVDKPRGKQLRVPHREKDYKYEDFSSDDD